MGALAQATNLIIGKALGGKGACGVAGMHTGFLNMFHNAADIQLLAVEQGINVDFTASCRNCQSAAEKADGQKPRYRP